MAANTFRNNTPRTPMARYINSTLQCNVVLDRLDQLAIDEIMKNSAEDNQKQVSTTSKSKRPLHNDSFTREKSPLYKGHCLSNEITTKTTTTRTTITTMTTEKTTVKQKSITTTTTATALPSPSPSNESKRFKKSSDNDCIVISDGKDKPTSSSSSTYKRIYLKCFICSKRQYIDAQTTTSDLLHSHWLEHGHDLSLNIYDSEIDSTLTRVVEFFHFPRRHSFEGKIQTVYILNSKEIRKTSPPPLDDENCIVLD